MQVRYDFFNCMDDDVTCVVMSYLLTILWINGVNQLGAKGEVTTLSMRIFKSTGEETPFKLFLRLLFEISNEFGLWVRNVIARYSFSKAY